MTMNDQTPLSTDPGPSRLMFDMIDASRQQ